jgi:hypothetical protein
MKNISIRILKVLLFVDLLLLLGSIFFGGKVWVYNTQIGFISATLIMIASVISYRRMVNTRVEHGIVTMDDSKDVIDKLEDPYDLYSEDVTENEEEQDLVEVVKEERKKLKQSRRSLGQTLKDTKAALSIYRLAAYAVLILGFMYLNRQGLLHIPSYLLALSLPPMIIVIMLVTQKENHSQD